MIARRALLAALLLLPGASPAATASTCEAPQLSAEGLLLLPSAVKWNGAKLAEGAAPCLQAIGAALAARPDLQGLTVASVHEPAARIDGLARARAVRDALVTGGLPASKISAVGPALGERLEVFVRVGSGRAPAPVVALADGAASAGFALGGRLEPERDFKVPLAGRLVVALPTGGLAELFGGSEGRVERDGRISLLAGTARLFGPDAELLTRAGVVRVAGEAELVLRGPGVIGVALRGEAELGGAKLSAGQGRLATPGGPPSEARPLLPAPARTTPGPFGPGAAGFAMVSNAHHYELEIAADASFRGALQRIGVAPEGELELPGEGSRWVRCRAVDADGVPGTWSVARLLSAW